MTGLRQPNPAVLQAAVPLLLSGSARLRDARCDPLAAVDDLGG